MIDQNDSVVYLSDVSERDKPWDKYGHAKSKASQLYRLVTEEGSRFWVWADRMDNCASQLDFVLKSNNDSGESKLKLDWAEFCRCPRCCVCQWRKSMMWRGRFINAIPSIMAGCPGHQFLFLTLTVKNCEIEQLRLTINHMNESWKRLKESKEFPATGFVKSLEVTRNPKTEQAHPHFHALLIVPDSYFKGRAYLKRERWLELWQRSLRIDYFPVLDIRTVRDKTGSSQGANALQKAALETIKYSVKAKDVFDDLDVDKYGDLLDTSKNWFRATWFMELTDQMYRLRTISLGGIFKQYLKEEDPEDLIHADGDEVDDVTEDDLHLFFDWSQRVKRYAKSDRISRRQTEVAS